MVLLFSGVKVRESVSLGIKHLSVYHAYLYAIPLAK